MVEETKEVKIDAQGNASTGTTDAMDINAIINSVGPSQSQGSPLERFYVVTLNTEGFGTNVSTLEERIRSTFIRLTPKQRAQVDYQKVRFYRTCASLSSFKLDKQWVIPRDRLNKLEAEFKDIQIGFEAAKNEIYRDLTLNWATIVDEVFKKHPDFPIPRDKIDEIRPTSPNFMSMDYSVRSLISVLNEMSGLKEVLSSTDLNPDIAERVERQKQLLASRIKVEYDKKIFALQETVEKLKNIAKKKGKRFEKYSLEAHDMKADLEEMAGIIGEKDMLKTKLEGMLEFLAEGMSNNAPY